MKKYKTAKGVSIIIEFNKFKNFLFNKKLLRHKMRRNQSKKHKLGTSEIDKISLSCFDGKMYLLDDGIYTLDSKIVLQVVIKKKILKKIVIKKIVIIEKHCDNF